MLASTNARRIDELDVFVDCTKAQLQQIGSLTTCLRIPKDHVLIREGSFAREFIVVHSGSARVTRETNDGVPQVAEVATGDFLGEMALLTGKRRTATASATTDLVVLAGATGRHRRGSWG